MTRLGIALALLSASIVAALAAIGLAMWPEAVALAYGLIVAAAGGIVLSVVLGIQDLKEVGRG